MTSIQSSFSRTEAQQQPPPVEAPTRRHRVLVVDDDRALLLALGEGLRARRRDIDVDTCLSADAALERVAATDYDAVVTDVIMNGMDGLTLLERIRTARPSSVVVLMTGLEDREVALRALRGGAYDLLEKPMDLEVFVASVMRAVETRQLRRENEEKQAALAAHAQNLERALAEAVETGTHQLREANRLKDEFFAVMSHELRTPLTAVLGWARLLRSGMLEAATQARALEAIERNARSLATLIDDLLDVSRISTGKLRLTTVRLEAVALIAAAIETALPDARSKGVLLDSEGVCDLPAICGDPDRLAQVLGNLLANAVKFTPAGGRVRVEVALDGSRLRIRVRDTGIGIRPEFLPLVFDRLQQDASVRHTRGLGLGLTIVRHLVELHSGRVEAHSDGPGTGATFTVWLPVLETQEPVAPPETAMSSPAASDSSRCLQDVAILVVDDDAEMRAVLTTTLRQAGAAVAVAATAREGREAFAQCAPDVLLCDIALPDEDGCALLRSLETSLSDGRRRARAIALTAHAGSEDRARALAAGFEAHVAKPGPADLPTMIAGLLGR